MRRLSMLTASVTAAHVSRVRIPTAFASQNGHSCLLLQGVGVLVCVLSGFLPLVAPSSPLLTVRIVLPATCILLCGLGLVVLQPPEVSYRELYNLWPSSVAVLSGLSVVIAFSSLVTSGAAKSVCFASWSFFLFAMFPWTLGRHRQETKRSAKSAPLPQDPLLAAKTEGALFNSDTTLAGQTKRTSFPRGPVLDVEAGDGARQQAHNSRVTSQPQGPSAVPAALPSTSPRVADGSRRPPCPPLVLPESNNIPGTFGAHGTSTSDRSNFSRLHQPESPNSPNFSGLHQLETPRRCDFADHGGSSHSTTRDFQGSREALSTTSMSSGPATSLQRSDHSLSRASVSGASSTLSLTQQTSWSVASSEGLHDEDDGQLLEEIGFLLKSAEPEHQQQAANLMRRASKSEHLRRALGVSESFEFLPRLCSSDNPAVAEDAFTALYNLSLDAEIKPKLGDVIPTAAQATQREEPKVAELACSVLYSLSVEESLCLSLKEQRAVFRMAEALKVGTEKAKLDACGVLYNVSRQGVGTDPQLFHDVIAEIIDSDAVSVLVGLLAPPDTGIAKRACSVLRNVSKTDAGCTALVAATDGLANVLAVVDSGTPEAQEAAVGVLLAVAECSAEYKRLVWEEAPMMALDLLKIRGTRRAIHKARDLLKLLRTNPGEG